MSTPRPRSTSGRGAHAAGFAISLALGVLSTGLGPGVRAAEPVSPSDPAVRAADAAIAGLRDRLVMRLLEELERGGVAGAVRVCRDEAQALTAEVAAEGPVSVGRTSHRLRNPDNAPPAWAAAHVEAAELEPLIVHLGNRVGVLRPIPTGAVCLQCHGPADRLDPEVASLLREGYPDDRAIGFAEGELRGFFWAESPRD
jgi:hypothetical protein